MLEDGGGIELRLVRLCLALGAVTELFDKDALLREDVGVLDINCLTGDFVGDCITC